jgi:DNA-binding NarL/FixJ family response regulator
MKLLIVEDDSLLNVALKTGLQTFPIDEIQSATTSSTAMQLFRKFDPDVVLLDIDLKAGPTGIDVAHAMRRLNSNVAIVFFTSLADTRLVSSSLPELPEGAILVSKNEISDLAELFEAIEQTKNGTGKVLSPAKRAPKINLSTSEFEIIRLVSEGLSNAEIAKRRVTTVKSTENAIARLNKKLQITNSSQSNQRVLLTQHYLKLTGKS